jgi:hypothetical protein
VKYEAIMNKDRNFDEKRGPEDYRGKILSKREMILFFIEFLG